MVRRKANRESRRLEVLSQQLDPSHAAALRHDGSATVCVTGATGFVGSWLVKKLLERGYRVRACVRDVSNERKVGFLKAMIRQPWGGCCKKN